MRQQAIDTLQALDRAFLSLPVDVAAPEAAREHALSFARAAAASRPDPSESTIALAFAVEMLLALPASARPDCPELRELIDTITALTETQRVVLARLVFAGTLPYGQTGAPADPDSRLRRALALGLVMLDAESVSVWRAGQSAPVRLEAAGETPADPRDLYAAAIELLAGDGPTDHAVGSAYGVRIQPDANGTLHALVCAGCREPKSDRTALLRTVASAVSEILTVADSSTGEPAGTAERRLSQLRFDLHDGPLQDVILLGEDLGLFASQLEAVLAEHPLRDRIVGRLDDLRAMLVALDGDLRRIVSLLESPFLRSQPFPDALAQITNAFAQRTETIPEVDLHGDLAHLSDSHSITLLALIREALNNIREHSRATRVAITVSSDPDGVGATVFDDGRGFDPEEELIRAARGGHLGLVGMHERVRVLGGVTRIESRPGGPTVISVSLPHANSGRCSHSSAAVERHEQRPLSGENSSRSGENSTLPSAIAQAQGKSMPLPPGPCASP